MLFAAGLHSLPEILVDIAGSIWHNIAIHFYLPSAKSPSGFEFFPFYNFHS